MSTFGKTNFTQGALVQALQNEVAQLRAALQSRTRLETLIETVAGGVATNPMLTPEEQAERTMAIVGALTNKIESLEKDYKAPTAPDADIPTQASSTQANG